MLVWLLIAIALAFVSVLELILGFSIPFLGLRATIIFLLVIGMSYRIYLMERDAEKEGLRDKVRELEDKLRAKELGVETEEGSEAQS